MGGSEHDIEAVEDDSGIRRSTKAIHTYEEEVVMTTHINMNHIAPLMAVGAAAVAIAVAETAAAATFATRVNRAQNPGNAQITAVPGGPAQEAAQLQQPFGGDMGAPEFHH